MQCEGMTFALLLIRSPGFGGSRELLPEKEREYCLE